MEHKGLRPLINPGIFRQTERLEPHSACSSARENAAANPPDQYEFWQTKRATEDPAARHIVDRRSGASGAARPLRRKAFSAGMADRSAGAGCPWEILKKRNISPFCRTAALCRPPAFYCATVTYFLYIYPVSPVLLTRTWYQFPQSERMVSRVPFLSLPRLL